MSSYSGESEKTPVIHVNQGKVTAKDDTVIKENILHIWINGFKAFEMIFTPGKTRELVAGFLYTQGVIKRKEDLHKIHFDPHTNCCHVELGSHAMVYLNNCHHIKGSSGGLMLNTGLLKAADKNVIERPINPILHWEQVPELMDLHAHHSILYRKTGAVHSAGLTDGRHMSAFFQDIGRHNALDKLAGYILLNDINSEDKVATLSCRMSLEITTKIIRTRIPIMISNSAPTLSAIELSKKHGVTMIGFARGTHFNIYTLPERIAVDGQYTHKK